MFSADGWSHSYLLTFCPAQQSQFSRQDGLIFGTFNFEHSISSGRVSYRWLHKKDFLSISQQVFRNLRIPGSVKFLEEFPADA